MTATITQKTTLISILGFMAAFGAAWAYFDEILEKLPIATESFVLDIVSIQEIENVKRDMRVIKLAGEVGLIQKQVLQNSEVLLEGQKATIEYRILGVEERLRANPSNPDAQQMQNILETQLIETTRRKRGIECDLLRLDRPSATC